MLLSRGCGGGGNTGPKAQHLLQSIHSSKQQREAAAQALRHAAAPAATATSPSSAKVKTGVDPQDKENLPPPGTPDRHAVTNGAEAPEGVGRAEEAAAVEALLSDRMQRLIEVQTQWQVQY